MLAQTRERRARRTRLFVPRRLQPVEPSHLKRGHRSLVSYSLMSALLLADSATAADDLVRPAGLEPTGPSPPFGGLTGMLDYFEGHLRHKHKKPADKGKMLGDFFGVSWLSCDSAE